MEIKEKRSSCLFTYLFWLRACKGCRKIISLGFSIFLHLAVLRYFHYPQSLFHISLQGRAHQEINTQNNVMRLGFFFSYGCIKPLKSTLWAPFAEWWSCGLHLLQEENEDYVSWWCLAYADLGFRWCLQGSPALKSGSQLFMWQIFIIWEIILHSRRNILPVLFCICDLSWCICTIYAPLTWSPMYYVFQVLT